MKKNIFLLILLLISNVGEAKMIHDIKEDTAIFAGGCFWCMEKPFDEAEGVISTVSGYTGGSVENPSYEQVSAGSTGHMEAIKVTYDSTKIGYKDLLDIFWINIDPLDSSGQFCDNGEQYTSAIFYKNKEQKKLAEESLENIEHELNTGISTKIIQSSVFYPAEEYHQNYYLKNPIRYKIYRYGCGRDKRLKEIWGPKAKH